MRADEARIELGTIGTRELWEVPETLSGRKIRRQISADGYVA